MMPGRAQGGGPRAQHGHEVSGAPGPWALSPGPFPQSPQPSALSPEFAISATLQQGLDELIDHLVGQDPGEGSFSARARHVDALRRVNAQLQQASTTLATQAGAELVAEDLRLAQEALAQITGRFDADALLGEIFSSFCIGK